MNNPPSNSVNQPPLAVVGLSALFPKSTNAEEFWSNVRRGVDSIVEVPDTHWNPEEYFDQNQKSPDMTYARRGGFLSPVPFDPLEFGISPNNLEAIDTSQLLGLVGAKRALEHAGYGAGRQFDRSRVGCILGVTGTLEMVIPLGARLGHPRWRKALKDAGVADDVADEVVNRISESYVPWQENSFPGLLGNVVAGRIANRLDLHGTNCVVDAACASSLSAIHLAALELWTGRSDMVVTGGIDTFNDIFMFMCFSKTPALSPSGDARPFSDDADGTILGEGVGILVLKRLADAQRDGDRIQAVIRGIGTSSDGAGNAVYAPKAEGQIRCLENAYEVAGVTPDTIELLEAHGTGTKVGDATEVSGLMTVYKASGRRGRWCAIGSVKSQIGHTKAAAGAAGVIKAILALQHRVLPPTIKVTQPPAALLADDSPFYVNTIARPWLKPAGYPRRAGVSAFGFGGSNFHCVLEESPQRFETPDWDGDVQVVALSAPSIAQLAKSARTHLTVDAIKDWPSLRTLAAATRTSFRVQEEHRLLLVLERDQSDLQKVISGALTMLERYPDRPSWSTPDGAYYGRGRPAGKVGFLFPGQGSQYIGMLRDLACRFPVMSDVLSVANDVFQSSSSHNGASPSRLGDLIYPIPAFDHRTRDEQESDLRATQVAQPAIGAVSLGALAILNEFGVHPEAVAGHSYGELTALCASQRFAPEALFRLSMLRGELMAASQESEGGMLAVGAPLSQIEAALKELSVDLVLANHNGPSQIVLSGRIPEIERAASLLASRNIRGKKLAVAAAFHSPLVAPASRAFRPVLDEVKFEPASLPVYANTTARVYPTEPDAARELLANQLAKPVQFVGQVEQMYADGVRLFLEVGPGSVLTGLVNSILGGRDFRSVAIDSSNGRRNGLLDLASALAQLSASGAMVRWQSWDPCDTAPTDHKQRLQIPICGANYVKPRTPLPPVKRPAEAAASRPPAPAAGPDDRKESSVMTSPPASYQIAPTPVKPTATVSPSPDSRRPEVISQPSPTEAIPQTANVQASAPGTAETIRQMLDSLQRMQQETSRLHQQFLEGQESAMKAYAQLAYLHMVDKKLSVDAAAAEMPAQRPAFGGRSVEAQISRAQTAVDAPEARISQAPVPAPATLVAAPTPTVAPAQSPAISPPVPVAALPPSPLGSTVLSVVAEKTGYPAEMLNLGMSLDHDLGIDSIKRVEILSALQERVANLPAFQPEELGSLHTLKDVVDLADARMGGVAVSPVSPAPVPQPVTAPPSANSVELATSALGVTVLAVVAEKTGYPAEMLNLGMSLDHDLGIDSIKRVEILSALQERVPNLPAFQPEELGSLHTLRDVVTLADSRINGSGSPGAPDSVAPSVTRTPPPVPSQPSLQAAPASSLSATVLAVVAEKTGYPAEMLNVGMSLDHDLGIDSIKRVEILSALQERVPNLPAFQPEELGALHTLNDVVTLADARASGGKQLSPPVELPAAAIDPLFASPTASHPAPGPQFTDTAHRVIRRIVHAIPLETASRRPLVGLQPGSEVLVTDDGLGFSTLIAQELQKRGYNARIVRLEDPQFSTVSTAIGGFIVVSPQQGISDDQLWSAVEWLQKLGPQLRRRGQSSPTIVAAVLRLDGRFGFDESKYLQDPVSGALAGLVKCLDREWPEVTCRAFDLCEEWTHSHVAAAMFVTEFLHQGPVEVGLTPGGPIALENIEQSLSGSHPGAPIHPGDVVVISGGARGVTAEAAWAVARAWRPHLVILGRTPEPAAEPDWLQPLATEAEIRQGLIVRATPDSTPRMISRNLQQILAGREIAQHLLRLRSLGIAVNYYSVDVRDPCLVRPLLARIRQEFGPVRGIIHGAGVLADHRIEDKTRDQFDLVYQTKVAGLRTLLESIDARDLRLLGLFSSYTARFGRIGQLDYAMANEVLNKQAHQFAIQHPECHVASFNWGPWDGGMVQGGLKQLFDAEGVGLIPLNAGAEFLVREFSQTASKPVEILVLADRDPGPAPTPAPPSGEFKVSFERELDVTTSPFLESHVLGGKAVLPVAMIMEWLAHGAIHRNPGLELQGFEDLRIYLGVRLGLADRLPLKVLADKPLRQNGSFKVPMRLVRPENGREVIHAAATVVLTPSYPLAPTPKLKTQSAGYSKDLSTAYATRLFHGAQFRAITAIDGCSSDGISVRARLTPAASAWMIDPVRANWLADPLAIDAALQAVILWSQEIYARPCLPCAIGRYQQFSRIFPREGVLINVQVSPKTGQLIHCDIEFLDQQGRLIAKMENCESVADPSLSAAFLRNQITH